jgi:hypothetical protein
MSSATRSIALLALVALALSLVGCSQTYRTLRSAEAAPNGEHTALETSDVKITEVPLLYKKREYLGYRFWTCRRSGAEGTRLKCSRICDDGDLECSVNRKGVFGKVSRAK